LCTTGQGRGGGGFDADAEGRRQHCAVVLTSTIICLVYVTRRSGDVNPVKDDVDQVKGGCDDDDDTRSPDAAALLFVVEVKLRRGRRRRWEGDAETGALQEHATIKRRDGQRCSASRKVGKRRSTMPTERLST
jgi:hypothetical protein